ncbi:MAG: MopE-related protein, partial [Kofleriaceae bacterium]
RGGGAVWGTTVGVCVAGVMRCPHGAVLCGGASGSVGGQPEACNGLDDDCDGLFDEGLTNLGSCGPTTDVGACEFGTLVCMSGGVVCVGAVGPTFELCDAIDQDCDGNPTNGYDLHTDPQNCGACGHSCNLPNAFEGCAGGECTVAACAPGFHDADHDPSNGCEYACTIQGNEVCNGIDDDCNGVIDDNIVLPPVSAFCRTAGECATGTTVTCDGAMGLRCRYTDPDVSLDAMGNIIPETGCEVPVGLDNDCDGAVDEGQPNLGAACDNGGVGDCRSTGVFQCDTANPHGPAICVITQPAPGMSAEVCDGRDNNCDGIVDNDASTGDMVGQDWVTIPGTTVQIQKWEASRPDATASAAGSLQTHACSRQNALPWTNITHPQAVAACASIGARLCTEAEWQRMCDPKPTYPIPGPAVGGFAYAEAEDALLITAGSSRTWSTQPTQDFSGTTALQALPDSGTTVTAANAPANAPRLDFSFSLAGSTTYYVWVRMMGVNNNGDAVHVGLGTNPGGAGGANAGTLSTNPDNVWTWRVSNAISISAAGTYTASVYMNEDGVRVDAVAVARQNTTPPPYDERTWAFASAPKTPQPVACNGDPLDTNPGMAGDQDDILPTGSLPACYANGPGAADAYDMSGNVKEWTAARAPGQNPLRGGASNNVLNGLTCGLNFTLADDSFFFPNVGFRCCK